MSSTNVKWFNKISPIQYPALMLLDSRDKSCKYTVKKYGRNTLPGLTPLATWNGSDKLIYINNLKWIMYKHIFFFLLLTLHVPFQIGKCTTRGTDTPVWKPLFYAFQFAYNFNSAVTFFILYNTLDVPLSANSVVTLLVNSRGEVSCVLCSPRQETLR